MLLFLKVVRRDDARTFLIREYFKFNQYNKTTEIMMTRQQMMMWDVLCGMSGEDVARAFTNYHGNRLLSSDFAEFLVDEGYCEPEEVGLDPDDYDEDDYYDDDDE